jgi:hypothetical protein
MAWSVDRVAGGNTDHIDHIWVDEWVDLTSHNIDAWEHGNWIAQVAALGHIAELKDFIATTETNRAKAVGIALGSRSLRSHNSGVLGASLVSSLACFVSVLLGLHRLGKRASLSNELLEARLVLALQGETLLGGINGKAARLRQEVCSLVSEICEVGHSVHFLSPRIGGLSILLSSVGCSNADSPTQGGGAQARDLECFTFCRYNRQHCRSDGWVNDLLLLWR